MAYMRIVLIACVSFAFILAGCDPKPMASKVGQPLEQREHVIVKAGKLHSHLRVASQQAERIAGDLLHVRLAIDNVDDDDLWTDIQVKFFDADGFELEETNRQPLFLKGDEVTQFETTSLSPKAADYTIILSNPRKSTAK